MSFELNRPRRPSPDTLSYLRSLPLEEKASEEEVKKYMDFHVGQKNKSKDNAVDSNNTESVLDDDEIDEPEYPRVLSAALSAIEEIKNEVASLAGDEYGSECIEILTRVGAKYSATAAKTLLEGVAGYHLHLATHRYGSHVVQTILQLAVHGSNDSTNDSDENKYSEAQIASTLELEEDDVTTDTIHTNNDGQPKSLQNIILNVVEELLPYVSELAVHVCGSHVLRTLLCALSGLELSTSSQSASSNATTTMRGKPKNKKKKKKKKKQSATTTTDPSTGNNNNNNAGLIELKRLNNPRINIHDSNVRNALESLIDAISMVKPDDSQHGLSPPGELQELACHPSASPLLTVLLKVLIGVYDDEDSTPATVIGDNNNKAIADYRLGIHPPQPQFQPNSRAEKFAKLLICWDDNATTSSSKDQKYAGDVIYGMSGESRGSHMLETMLRTANDDFYNVICTAGGLFNPSALKEYIRHDVSNFVVQTLLSTVRTKSQAEQLLECLEPSIEDGYLVHSINKRRGVLWRAVEMAAKFRVGQERVLKNIRVGFGTTVEIRKDEESKEGDNSNQDDHTSSLPSIEDCIPKLLEIKYPENDGSRIGLDAAGTRTIYHLLRFVPRLCGDVLTGILSNLNQQELEWIANDGLGSRCIMDGILDGEVTEKCFSNAVKKLLGKMSGRWVSLSVERVGHHTVRKVFSSLKSIDDKAVLSAELASGINKLNGTSMGRSIISSCFVKDFLEGETVWSEAVRKQSEKDKFIKEFIENDNDTDMTDKPKKRKRKRKKGSTRGDDDTKEEQCTTEIGEEKKKKLDE